MDSIQHIILDHTLARIGDQRSGFRYSLTDICGMFNFSSPAHFSRYVQTNLGAKPSDFRE